MDGTCSMTRATDVETFTYVAGRLTQSTGRESDMRTMYTYDGSRLTRIVRTEGGELALRMDLRYDSSGHLDSQVTLILGEDRTTLDEVERRVFAYDASGRLMRTTHTRGSRNEVCEVEYDVHERLASVTCETDVFPAETPYRATYAYDAAGRLSEVGMSSTTLTMHFDAAGRRERIEATSDTGEVRTSDVFVYDAEGREVEWRIILSSGTVDAVQIAFEGTFGAGAVCGAAPPPPPGIPKEIPSIWFDMNP